MWLDLSLKVDCTILHALQVHGLFWPSILALHPCFRLDVGIVVDDLHGLYLGVALKLLHLWLDKQFRSQAFSTRNQVHHLWILMLWWHYSICDTDSNLRQKTFLLKFLMLYPDFLGHWKILNIGKVCIKLTMWKSSSVMDIVRIIGSELRNWVMCFSLPVLSGILEIYLSHFALFVAAIQQLGECHTMTLKQPKLW